MFITKFILAEELQKKREDIAKELVEVEERLKKELEKALEQKPSHMEPEEDAEMRQGDEQPALNDLTEFHSEEEEGKLTKSQSQLKLTAYISSSEPSRRKLVSQIVKSQVKVSIKNDLKSEKRHVLQSSVNKKMIISVVNNTAYDEGGGRI